MRPSELRADSKQQRTSIPATGWNPQPVADDNEKVGDNEKDKKTMKGRALRDKASFLYK